MHPNDLIGGWSVNNVDKPVSECDWHVGEGEVADFMSREDAELIASLRNQRDELRATLKWVMDNSDGVIGLKMDGSLMPWSEVQQLYLLWTS